MKTSTLVRNGVSPELVSLISRLVDLIPWPVRRSAMGDVTLLLLDGKHRVAEDVFGWGRSVVEVGIKEFQTGISCVNDISTRLKPKTEEKHPELLAEIRAIMEPHSESESHLRTTLLYTNIEVAQFVRTVFSFFKWSLCLLLGCLFNRRQHHGICFVRGSFL